MKSAQIKGYGSTSDVIEIDQNTPAPTDPTDGKVLVKVKAAGVNPTDWKISEGYMQQIMPLEFPATLGWDFSGIVEKAGAGVSDIKQGDEAYGRTSGTLWRIRNICRNGIGKCRQYCAEANNSKP